MKKKFACIHIIMYKIVYVIYIEYIKYGITVILRFVKKNNAKVIFQSFNHYSYYFFNIYR